MEARREGGRVWRWWSGRGWHDDGRADNGRAQHCLREGGCRRLAQRAGKLLHGSKRRRGAACLPFPAFYPVQSREGADDACVHFLQVLCISGLLTKADLKVYCLPLGGERCNASPSCMPESPCTSALASSRSASYLCYMANVFPLCTEVSHLPRLKGGVMASTIVKVDDVVVWDDSNDPQHQSEHLYQRHGQRKHEV